jgi:hypothetical protein
VNGSNLKRTLLALFVSGAVFTAGCANFATTATSVNANAETGGATFGGRIHGGNQPVSNADVTLYYAGQNGFGSGDPTANPGTGAPVVAATTTSATDGTGSFTFHKSATNGLAASGNTFSCPTDGDPVVYVIAKNGNTINSGDPNVKNTAAAFIGVYGPCSTIGNSNFIHLSEVTSVATMAAITQYFNPTTESVGADGIGATKQALINTIGTISNMVDLSTGTALTSNTLSSGALTVTATPDSAKINALADIIAACVNNASASAPACLTLFANVPAPNSAYTVRPYQTVFNPPTDVLQALYFIFTNPTNGGAAARQSLLGLVQANSPYQPALSVTPADWSVAITYSSTTNCGASNGGLINNPQELNIDLYGNVWIANGQATTGNMTELNPSGTPLNCVFLGGGGTGGGVVDNSGNVWYASASAKTITRYNPYTQATLTFTAPDTPLAIFSDGGASSTDTISNIYFSTPNALYMISHGATLLTANTGASDTPTLISSVVGANPGRIMVDRKYAIWVTSGAGLVSRVIASSDPVNDPNYLNGYSTSQYAVPDSSYGLSITPASNVFVSSNGDNNLISYLTGTNATDYSLTWPSSTGQGGINNPTAIAVDGRWNIWSTNGTANSGTGLFSLSSLTLGDLSLTPDGTTAGGLQFGSDYLAGAGRSMVIDHSGNIWIASDGVSGNPSNVITEILGTAVPVFQPYAIGLTNGRFQAIP